MVREERARRRADLERGQDRGVHLKEAAPVQITAQFLQDAAALDERVLDLRVDDQIQIPLAVAGVGVAQAVVFLRQRQQRFAQQRQLRRVDGDLARLGAEHPTFDAEDVADVPLFEIGIAVLADVAAADVQLDPALAVVQVDEACLAHDPAAHHPPGQRDLHRLVKHQRFALGGRAVRGDVRRLAPLVSCARIDGVGREVVSHDLEGVLARRPQGGKLIAAHLEQLVHLLLRQFLLRRRGRMRVLLAHVILAPLSVSKNGGAAATGRTSTAVCTRYPFGAAGQRVISSTVYSTVLPFGRVASPVSPTRRPITALPTGDSSEILPWKGSASVAPAIS